MSDDVMRGTGSSLHEAMHSLVTQYMAQVEQLHAKRDEIAADRDRLAAEVERLKVDHAEALRRGSYWRDELEDIAAVIDSCRGLGHGTSLADAVRYISKLYTDLLHGAYAATQSDLDATTKERDAAIASRDSAVAERDELRAIVDPVRGRELIAGLQQARDSAVNDTAEAIARWLEEIGCPGHMVKKLRAGAWRGQNGGE